jgi:type IV pilus assembly protein PilW
MARSARHINAGLDALHVMTTHLRQAGFSATVEPRMQSAIFGCSRGRPVGPKLATSCEPDNRNSSDAIEVRHVANTVSTWTTSAGKPTDCLGQAVEVGSLSVSRFFTRRSPSSGRFELYCEGSGRLGKPQPIVEGIERLQIRYRLTGSTQFVDATGISDDQWPNVEVVELGAVVQDAQYPRTLKTWVSIRNRPK